MYCRIQVLDGPDVASEVASLWDWLRREPEFRGRIDLEQRAPAAGEMGAVADVLAIAVGSGGAATALLTSLSGWLGQRHAGVTVEVTGPGGRAVKVSGWRDGDVMSLVRELLGSPAGGQDHHAAS
jgi:hypothetical protein